MNKNIVIGVLALIVLGLGALTFVRDTSLGSSTGPQHYSRETFLQGLQIAQTGTEIAHAGFAACNLIGTDSSLAASTTAAYDCAITGITSTDKVIALLASTTPRGGSSSWEITAAKASTTAGYATVLLTNNGPAATPSVTSVGSSTAVWFFR
jgi:hypothetical protein